MMVLMNETRLTLTEGLATTSSIDLGLKDAKGRAIGYLITRYEATVVEAAPGRSYRLGLVKLGAQIGQTIYVAHVTVTRDGAAFGASAAPIWALTAEDATKQVERRIAGGRKRYAA